MEESDKMIYM